MNRPFAAVSLLFERNFRAQFRGQRFGYPKIGAGLTGGNGNGIASILDEKMAGGRQTLVVREPG